MSLETWKKEFYPIPANSRKIKTELAAVEHALQKWEGLRARNLKKHEVAHYTDSTHGSDGKRIEDRCGQTLPIVDSSCSLCVRHPQSCEKCCLFKIRKGSTCFEPTGQEHLGPYVTFVTKGDPSPMIRLLRKAKAKLLL